MRFRVQISGGVFNDIDGAPLDLMVEDDELPRALFWAGHLLHQRLASIDLVLSEEGHRVASCELEVVKCKA